MKETILKIGLAALLHDIGKFAQGNMEITKQYAIDNADQYQPFYNNRHTHIHALYTAAFIEQFADSLPEQMNRGGWGEGDSFVNLAAAHHKPNTPMEWIIAQADRTSSGLDRDSFEKGEKIAFQDVKKTRLLPIFEQLDPENNKHFADPSDFKYRYPLEPVNAQSIFPVRYQEELKKKDAEQEYSTLFDIFTRQLKKLKHRQTDISLWASHLDSLLLTTTAAIPAARVGDVVHDVSLYDHARTTAAFASALYCYHAETDSMDTTAIKNNDMEKFLLVTGDFYGIQNFIFSAGGEMKKFRSKILRGRSFSVSLFTELAADFLCRKIGLTFLSVLFNAAGKFTILAPNTEQTRETVQKAKNTLNDWLHEISYGQSSIGIAVTPCRPADFYSGSYCDLHDNHISAIQREKLQKLDLERYGGPITGYLESFDARFGLCSLCGKRPATEKASTDHTVFKDEGTASCPICRDHILLGSLVAKKDNVLGILKKDQGSDGQLHKSFFDEYQLEFLDSHEPENNNKNFLKLWQINLNPDGSMLSNITMRPLNGYIPLYREEDNMDEALLSERRSESKNLEMIDQIIPGSPKTFNHIALKAKKTSSGNNQKPSGTEAIGVLKADVDNLGLLLGCGLPDKRITLSRLATLSRQLDHFFSIYLPTLLRENEMFQDVYTVFAGGDDLFLIGPWNVMAPLVSYLAEQFQKYVCENPAITFSAGISVHKPHVPVDKLARAAEESLEHSKNTKRKNSITMFGQTVSRDTFDTLLKNREEMESWLRKKYISKAMMYRFNHLITLAEKEKAVKSGNAILMEDMEAMKWRALFHYSIERNINSSFKDKKREQAVQDLTLMAKWMDQYGGGVRIPLWHLLYDKR